MEMYKLFKIRYRFRDEEFTANIVGVSSDDCIRYLTQQYGELSYYKCMGSSDIHLILPEVEKLISTRLKNAHTGYKSTA